MSQPIRILHVFSRLQRGGAELRTVEILRHVDRFRYRLDFCSLSGLPGELDDDVRALGSEVHLLRRGWVDFPRRFRKLLRQQRFDVIYSHVLDYSGVVLRLAAQCNTPLRAAVFRSPYNGRAVGPIREVYRKLMCRWTDRYATHVVAVSEGVMNNVWGPRWRADRRCRVIYNGLDLTPFEETTDTAAVRREFGLPVAGPLYVHVGRMREPKNHLRLLSIFARVLQRQASARLLLVGEGGNRIERRVWRRVAELGLAGRVVLAGQRTDVPRLLKAADALIFPSLWEGLPGAVLEARAAGTPVLASDLPGIREIAARLPGVRCLSLTAGDAKWAEVVEEISTGQDAKAARRVFAAGAFTIGRCVEQHCQLWEEVGRATVGRNAA